MLSAERIHACIWSLNSNSWRTAICQGLCLTLRKNNKPNRHGSCSYGTHSFAQPYTLNQFSSVQLLSCVRLFGTPWTAACQASLSIINSQSLLKLMSIESVMPSNHLILCCLLLLPPSILHSIRVFSNESTLRIPDEW